MASEFEIETWIHPVATVRNSDNSGTVNVAAPAVRDVGVGFAIAIP